MAVVVGVVTIVIAVVVLVIVAMVLAVAAAAAAAAAVPAVAVFLVDFFFVLPSPASPLRFLPMGRFLEHFAALPFNHGGYFVVRKHMCASTWMQINRPRTRGFALVAEGFVGCRLLLVS